MHSQSLEDHFKSRNYEKQNQHPLNFFKALTSKHEEDKMNDSNDENENHHDSFEELESRSDNNS